MPPHALVLTMLDRILLLHISEQGQIHLDRDISGCQLDLLNKLGVAK
jgi:hypothetical protein